MLEPVTRVEPLGFEEIVPEKLADLALMVQAEAAGLGRGLHPDSARELGRFVRIMNSYYSNLIEGHNTRPRDIEAALAGAELAPETRPLAIQAASV